MYAGSKYLHTHTNTHTHTHTHPQTQIHRHTHTEREKAERVIQKHVRISIYTCNIYYVSLNIYLYTEVYIYTYTAHIYLFSKLLDTNGTIFHVFLFDVFGLQRYNTIYKDTHHNMWYEMHSQPGLMVYVLVNN